MADPSVRTIKVPNNRVTIIIGASHHFFLSLRYDQNSNSVDALDIGELLKIRCWWTANLFHP